MCWGCDRYCGDSDLAWGNGADRTMHPAEMLGDDWYGQGDWGLAPEPSPAPGAPGTEAPVPPVRPR
ncbi:DUF3079 domain-containing protein [Pseudomonas sp. DR208]|uniref:DUF3079 domain-containing protein n=1 Tax=Pseudomonas sp. DR208 TaxID=2870840 RepID=UPI0021BDCFDC|nr:DUF3079 domain-containing protein [Pseudomonas sp. DR208]